MSHTNQHVVDLTTFRKRDIRPFDIVDRTRNVAPDGTAIDFTNYYMTVGGKPFFGVSGEFHFSRMDESRWDDELAKCAAGGVNVIANYVFWNHHEEREGHWDFTGSRDLRRFTELCAKHGMYMILRMGPFDHGEVRNGGVPDWVYGKDYEARSLDAGWLAEVRELYTKIFEQVDGLLFDQGGPIIGAQLDNEYMHSSAPWEMTTGISDEWVPGGSDGIAYLEALRGIAHEVGIKVPFYTATGWGGAPVPDDVLPLWGGYAYRPWLFYAHGGDHPKTDEYLYRDFHANDCPRNDEFDPSYQPEDKPYACCEMGGGMTNSYNYRFVLPMKSVDAMTNIKMGSGCNFLGYYMYHGGTNPTGDGVYLNEGQVPKKSYDYQAGLGEFGQVRESYGRMKTLHYFGSTFADRFVPMSVVIPADQQGITPDNRTDLRYAIRTDGTSGFVFLNNFQDHDTTEAKRDETLTITLASGRTVTFEGIGLAPEENCVLPFNMDLDGIMLEAATVQPVTAITLPGAGHRTFVFMRPDGMGKAWLRFADGDVIDVDDAADFQTFTVTKDGTTVDIVVISRAKADEMTVIDGEALAFAPGALFRDGDMFKVESRDTEITVSTYPAGYLAVADGSRSDVAQGGATAAGGLGTTTITLARKTIEPAVERLSAQRFAITLPDGFMDGTNLKDVLLQVRYTGDIGWMFANAELINDNFCNGDVWEIGMKENAARVAAAGNRLVFVITPLKKGVNVNVDSPMAARMEHADEQIAELGSVAAQPVYEITLRKS
ncbi:beta-galactosidase [Bifidobacterium simiiventris]|uniref:beta-galactosidase n=1 Tax=Bifidobacterium simiiventris TaxID=2834434 RepID=UPI001C588137|nr:beta-galactosidase [Bifidobacterium simiiventris]MBW3078879.1 beta-galactosidase [Bifidobacterium simiiventris]